MTAIAYRDKNGTTHNGTFSYDAVGNPLTYNNGKNSWTFTWKHGRQLATAISGNTTITNTYDVGGIRDSKTVNGVKHSYTTLGGKIVREAYGANVIDYFYDNNGRPYKIVVKAGSANPVTGYFVLNLQGDVIGIIDSNGAVAVEYQYDAWGKEISHITAGDYGSTLYNHNALKYRGYYYDSETGFYYVSSRYYDPEIGRFINADTIELVLASQTTLTDKNLYAYCDNNPVMRIDVVGYYWETIFDVVSLGCSVLEVMRDPRDAWNWIGLIADAVDLIPVVTGLGESVRGIRVANKVDDIGDTSRATSIGWKVGDDITNLTKAGNEPSWQTVRSRYWKNEAYYNSSAYTPMNLERMKCGKAPLVKYVDGNYYSMELHHIEPRHMGGSNSYNNLLIVTPWEHSAIDPYRHFKSELK